MSVDTDVAVVDLPETERSIRTVLNNLISWFWQAFKNSCKKLWLLARVTGPLVLLLLVLKIPDAVGLAAAARHFFWFGIPVPSFTPEVRLILSPRIEVLSSAVKSLSWEQFVIIGVIRRMVADPLYYYIGKRGGRVIASDDSTKSGRLAIRLENASHWKVLSAVGLLTFVESFIPTAISIFLVAFNPYIFAGTAEIKLKWVLLVDALASITFMAVFFLYGPDLVNAVREVF